MGSYEYKVVPAPVKGMKGRGIRGPEGRFAHSLEHVMNEMAAEGWEYQRAETLPAEEKTGLVGAAQTVYRNVLVFRRARSADLSAFDPRAIGEDRPQPLLPAPDGTTPTETTPDVATETGEGIRGLANLLRRRAVQVQDDPDSDADAPVEELSDLASRFSDEDEGGGKDAPEDAETSALDPAHATDSAADDDTTRRPTAAE